MADHQYGGVRAGVKGCLRVVMALMAVVVLLVGWGIWHLYQDRHPTAPDVRALAASASVRAADASSTNLTDHQLAQLRAKIPWSDVLGTSVADGCEAQFQIGFPADSWSPVQCERETVVYAAFDGNPQQRLRQLDAALQQLRWQSLIAPGGEHQTLSAQAEATRSAAVDVSEAYLPAAGAAQPSMVTAPYTSQPDRTSAVSASYPFELTVSVARKPGAPQTDDTGWLAELDPAKAAGSDARRVTYDWQPLSFRTVSERAYAAHAYLLRLSLRVTYFAQVPTATPTPVYQPPTASPHCFSGSTNCN